MIQNNVLAKINEKSYLSLMLKRFKHYIIENNLFQTNEKILVAVSGGIDSVVLCQLLSESGFSFSIAHCNFNLRGEESIQDENFVKKLAETYGVPIFCKHLDAAGYGVAQGISIQMAARELRYTWFNDVAKAASCDWISTAHHANDLLETMLLNLTRGTGIAGLHGIAPKSGRIVRPMLTFTKQEIIDFARENSISFREDSSNKSNKYHRNLIRNQVIPLLKQINPGLEKTIEQTAEKVGSVERYFIEKTKVINNRCIKTSGDIVYLDMNPIFEEEEQQAVLFQLLSPYNFSWPEVKNILLATKGIPGKRFFSVTHELVTDRGQLVITALKEETHWQKTIEHFDTNITSPLQHFAIQRQPIQNFTIVQDPAIASLDAEKLQFPLFLRPWQEGDFFYPLGMRGKKKISDYLIDKKIPLNLKRQISVLVSGNDIVWLVNYRIDDRFKVTVGTKEVYSIIPQLSK